MKNAVNLPLNLGGLTRLSRRAAAGNRRRVVPPWMVRSLLGLALALCVYGAAPVVRFEWSMPDRSGLDRNADGLIDYPRPPLVIDNSDTTEVSTSGSWRVATYLDGYYGPDYLHDINAGKGAKTVEFTTALPESTTYEVALWYPAQANLSPAVPVDIIHAGGSTPVLVDQTVHGGQWHTLGTFHFNADRQVRVRISNAGTTGYVVADAVRFRSLYSVAPDSWTVKFDASASSGSIARLEVRLDGIRQLQTVGRVFDLSFPAEGVYSVEVTAVSPTGQRASLAQPVVVQDWLIIGVGDSYASGEGSPDIPIAGQLFDDYQRVSDDLAGFTDQLRVAQEQLTAAKTNYDDVRAQTAAAWVAWQRYQEAEADRAFHCDRTTCITIPFVGQVCGIPDPDSSCPAATTAAAQRLADLGVELVKLGLEASVNAVQERLAAVEQAALTAWNAAKQAVSDLEASIEESQFQLGDIQAQAEAVWQNEGAHRSAWSGQAQAALLLEKADARTSVTFVHLAESGAVISGAKRQFEDLATHLCGREIDGILISAGGNDARFSDVIKSLIKYKHSHLSGPLEEDPLGVPVVLDLCASLGIPICDENASAFAAIKQSATAMFTNAILELASEYQNLNTAVSDLNAGSEWFTLSERVYITEYPDLSTGDNGAVCDASVRTPGVEKEEWAWVGNTLTPQLNAEVKKAAEICGWNYVGGIFDAFRRHGFCASGDERWVNGVEDSLRAQGDIYGMAHPNRDGYQAYAQFIWAALRQDLYSGEDFESPRPPGPPPASRPLITPTLVMWSGRLYLEFFAELGRDYTLQYTAAFGQPWHDADTLHGSGSETSFSVARENVGARFFRVRVD